MPDPNPLGPKPAREWTPGLQLIVYDPEDEGNAELDKVELDAQAGARIAEVLDAALETDVWRTGGGDFCEAAALALSALQPDSVGGAAFENAEAYVRVGVLPALFARIAVLETLLGAGGIITFEPGVFESGVFVE